MLLTIHLLVVFVKLIEFVAVLSPWVLLKIMNEQNSRVLEKFKNSNSRVLEKFSNFN